MPRTKEQNEAIRLATKEKIHSAGIKLFAKKGLAATSVKDISEEAAISIGLMYRHYKKKEELYYELVEYAATSLRKVNEKFESAGEPIVLIEEFTEEIVNDLKKGEQYAQFSMLMSQTMMEWEVSAESSRIKEQSEKLINNIIRLIEKGQKLNQFKSGNPKEMAYMYLSTIQGRSMLNVMNEELFVTPDQSKIIESLIKN